MNEHKDILAAVSKRLRSDQYARFLGIQITQIERGSAQAELTVVEHMLNFNKVTRGGVIFSLADVAFAAACNSFNQTSVASPLHIVYRKPLKLGTKLIAEEKRRVRAKTLPYIRLQCGQKRIA
ncbi:MAG: hotdog fold thioesterase [Halobacteriota archaeon]